MLLVDNYDSYTYNLFQLIAVELGIEPEVISNDDPAWATLDLDRYDAVVLSPGPGRPGRDADFGQCRAALRHGRIPVLGVCLGHQGIGEAAGARVVSAPQPRHGHLTTLTHTGDDLFRDIPRTFTAVRYHSLCLAEPLPDGLLPLARAEDGVVMAVRHATRPWWGVQFHPESVSSEYGALLIRNFQRLCRRRPHSTANGHRPIPAARPAAPVLPAPALRVRHVSVGREVDAEAVFDRLFRDSDPAFWLDSARVEGNNSRFSFLGNAEGPLGEVIDYRAGQGSVEIRGGRQGRTAYAGSLFDVLESRLRATTVTAGHDLPFDFTGGYVGYLGYEVRQDCGSPHAHRGTAPDAQWLFCDRFVAVDHQEGRTYAVALCPADKQAEADEWLRTVARILAELPGPRPRAAVPLPRTEPRGGRLVPGLPPGAFARPEAAYLRDIAECQRLLREGESYELCLTNTATLPAPRDPAAFYRRLRTLNPAPYAALLRFGETWVLSSSPERFLKVDRHRMAESRPIKGTAPRSDDPVLDEKLRRALQTDAKTRAENLMIVDLLRNDLGRVCAVGSVEVPAFLATASYATVHQLVSTIRGRLRPDVTAVAAVRACFPGGSMTGAPKQRSMEILDRLEGQPRGIYSGALGYFSTTGATDLSIVIRTAVVRDDALTVGAGGAIVLDSDPADEYAEMLLKAAATLQALPDPQEVRYSGSRGSAGPAYSSSPTSAR
ncbi:aminodeoxychorismate synthase component I [Streptomyces sp. 184]|uniref:aminodeoxychorismate synthase component I n=1 Tax=Streptomyces sp. 184 TaxID=1827526 RepID=UPI0038912415